MDQLWKWVMHLNAKAFCLTAALFFFGVAGWCGFRFLNPPTPLKDGGDGKLPAHAQPWAYSTLDFVSNQLAAEALSIPVDPFRPTIEAIFTNETERAAFLKALRAAQNAAAGIASTAGSGKKEDPFAHLRRKDPEAGGMTGANGQPMVIPKLTFLGFFQRPDGTKTAMFNDSANDTTVFYDSGKQVHGVDVVNASVREAEIRFPDGTSRKLEIGSSVELAAEPDARPKKAVPAPPVARPAAAAGAAAAALQKQRPIAKPGAPQKPVQKPVQKLPGQKNPGQKNPQKPADKQLKQAQAGNPPPPAP
jgi:hypothetical protein